MPSERRSPAPLGGGAQANRSHFDDGNGGQITEAARRPQPAIEVLAVHPGAAGNVKAFASIRIGSLTIHGCKIVQHAGKKAWVALPSQQGNDGKWRVIVECSDKAKLAAITAAVLSAWEKTDGRA